MCSAQENLKMGDPLRSSCAGVLPGVTSGIRADLAPPRCGGPSVDGMEVDPHLVMGSGGGPLPCGKGWAPW